ncbi:external alternative NAD(P)H-ubiquinone oxidoreductase B1, mitochondrial-like protein [Tanacetum coccineum]
MIDCSSALCILQFSVFLLSFDCTGSYYLSICSGGGLVAYAESQSSSATNSTEVEPLKKKKVVVLGTGWASTSFLKDLDISSYDVQVVSPRNYFAFTPLLPSVTCGTVEARSIVEPVRNIIKKKNGEIQLWEAECTKIDAANKKVFCRSVIEANLVGKRDFSLDYDYLVVAAGAEVNTFNTPGVKEYCHFLKEVEDAQKIRMSVIDCFEKAILPDLTEEERRINLHFVIVGGGPTGVEFAAELHDFVHEDLVKLYPSLKDMVKITVIQSGDHILNTENQSTWKMFFYKPRGMVVWSTGVSTRPVVKDFMDQIDQGNRRVLATDEWLRVKGCEDVYAIGDCATIDQRKVMEDISAIFTAADKDNSGTLSVEEFQDIIDDILVRYPQVELHLRDKHLASVTDLLRDPEGNARKEVDIEGFRLALSQVDLQMKSLPATAQVAAQQGTYLSNCFNKRELAKLTPEGPRRFKGSGRHDFCPFRYKHFGQFAPLGGEQAAAELPGDWVSVGRSTQWLWYSVYARGKQDETMIVVSPRYYFAFTPLLPSVTCGTVEARSIVEPKNGEIQLWEAECTKIDAANKKVFCRSVIEANLVGKKDFSLDYDYLVVTAGAEVNTFNTPGVKEYCHFLKEVEDAQRIRMSVIDCFEKAILPELPEEERRINLHFVIVGGGPTGVEFAAELHDFVHEDLVKLYPSVKDMVKITVIQSGDHILNTYDSRISTFAEAKFTRDGINVCTGTRVLSVSDKEVNMKIKSTGENVSIPRGMVVWSTGVSTRPVVKDFMDQIDQGNRRVLATDEWLRVKGCEDVYAIGDCATIDQRKVMEDISAIFTAADKDNSGTLSVEEFQDIIDDILIRYPQVELHLRDKHLASVTDLLRDPEGNARKEVDIEGFRLGLSQVDLQMKSLPATAQVAAQQGTYLSNCFNKRELTKLTPEGPRKFKGSGRHDFCPFRGATVCYDRAPKTRFSRVVLAADAPSSKVLPVARELGEGVLWKSAEKLKPYLMQAVTALGDPLDTYTEIVTSAGFTELRILLAPDSGRITSRCTLGSNNQLQSYNSETNLVGSKLLQYLACPFQVESEKLAMGVLLSDSSGLPVPSVEWQCARLVSQSCEYLAPLLQPFDDNSENKTSLQNLTS